MLFRYSALTFNGHRIHYDRDYVRAVEGYPDLVVHGPLIATLLLDLFLREQPDAPLAAYAFRARSPAFAGAPLLLNGSLRGSDRIRLWATTPDGSLVMEAEARLAR